MRALFVGLPLHGHINPSLPLVRALVERGDEVVYCATPPFAAAIEQAGARFIPYRTAALFDLGPLSARLEALSSFLAQTTGEVLLQDLDVFRAERPDYVVTDSVAPWGQYVGQILGVPVITSIPTFAVNRHVFRFAASSGAKPKSARLVFAKIRHVVKAAMLGRALKRRYGVKGTSLVGLMFGSSALNIVHTSPEFQPCAKTFDERFLFVGPSVDARVATERFAWDPRSPEPLVYVALGTLFNEDPAFYRDCFSAFGGERMRVLMSIGTAVPAGSLGPAPPNIVVKASVPQLEVLKHAAAFVSHGGMNSVGESLHHGVPLVVVPQMGEQELVGHQVQRLGAGVRLARKEVTAATLREAVHRVLSDRRFREQAARLGDSFRAAGGAGRGADAILAFTRSAP